VSWFTKLLVALFCLSLVACQTRGEAELVEIRSHVEQMTHILQGHSDDPRLAIEKLEAYEQKHRVALADLNERIKDLRHELTSSEKRQLDERWKNETANLEEQLKKLNQLKSVN
jgi:Skp family chaperone for outer membrane proteins